MYFFGLYIKVLINLNIFGATLVTGPLPRLSPWTR